jgi:hypothetical protein
MLRLNAAITIAFLLSTLLATSRIAQAQEEPQFVGSVEVASSKATKVRKLSTLVSSDRFNGIRGVFTAPEGQVFLVLHLELKPTFAKNADGDDVSYANAPAITLGIDRGQPVWSIGTCDPHGRFMTYPASYSFYRSDEPQTAGFDPVFLVPANATAATLTLGEAKHAIAIPEAVQEQIDPTQAIQLQAPEAKVARELRRNVELGAYELGAAAFPQQIVSTAGRFALVSIVMKPKVRNQRIGYGADVSDFGLLLGKEVYVRPIGVYDGESFSDYASDFYFEQDALGEFNAGKATLVFPLPGAVSSGKLLYLGAPVADVTFGG